MLAQSEPERFASAAHQLAEADAKGFEALYALRKEFVPADFTESQRRELRALAVQMFLPWCRQAAHAVDASKVATTLAIQVAEHDLACGHDSARAVAVLDSVWPFRDQADYRACELALTLAEARRAAGDYAGVEQALDHFAGLRHSESWQDWSKHPKYGPMLPIHELVHECRRAMLELELGNPDGALHRLQTATNLQRVARATPPEDVAAVVARAWRAAEVEFHRTRVDCYFALGCFGPAVAAADAVLARPELHEHHPMFTLYRALAEYWHSAAPGATANAHRVVKEFTRHENPEWRRAAQLCLLEDALHAMDPTDSDAELSAWLDEQSRHLEPRATTLQTGWMLRRDRTAPLPEDRIAAQAAAQARAWQAVAASWAATPVRDGGVGFLHYLDRRDDLVQLVAITLRVGERDGKPTSEAVAKALEYVMAAQVHGAMARALRVTTPRASEVQAALRPGHAVLLFLPASAGTHVFAVTADDIEHHVLKANAMSLRDNVQAFLDLLQLATGRVDIEATDAERLAAQLRTAGQDLVDTLFPAALRTRLANWQALTVVGAELLHGPISGRADAGFLNYLPLECLPWGNEQLFGQRFAIDHNASLPVWLRLAARASPAGPGAELRVFGALGPGEGAVPPLVAADGAAPKAAVRQYLDAQCTLANVQAESTAAEPAKQPAGARIAVFLGHGGYDAANERGSWFQLHDECLRCEQAQALGGPDAPFADLVVLAACRAAKGPSRAGDSLANLGGAFQLAGATTVVQSRFDLPLRGTHALLGALLRELAAGTPCAEAMRRARARRPDSEASPLHAYRTGVLQVHGCGQRHAGQ